MENDKNQSQSSSSHLHPQSPYTLSSPLQADDESNPRVGRPQRPISTIAQSFANDLDSMFGLGASLAGVDTLSQTVEEKKRNVSAGQSELEQLEARLQEAEQRLAKVSRQNSPARPPPPLPPSHTSGPAQANTGAQMQPPSYPAPKPPTTGAPWEARGQEDRGVQQAGGRDDYVMVEDGRNMR